MSSRCTRLLAFALILCGAAGGFAQVRDRSALHAVLYQALDQGALPRAFLTGLMREPTTRGRAMAVGVLASAAQESNLPLLGAFMGDLRPEVQRQVMLAAGRIGVSADGLAMTGLGSSSTEVRRAAAWAACHTGGRAADAVLELLAEETDRRVLENALANVWRLQGRQWEAQVAAFANHRDALLRRAAAYSLARGDEDGTLPAIRALCQDGEPVIRATALRGLERRSVGPKEVEILAQALGDDDWRVAAAACRVVEVHSALTLPAPAAGRVAALWMAPQPHLAMAAVRAAGSHEGIGENDRLLRLAADAAPWLATEALHALARRGADEAAAIATRWIAGEPWQRRAAAGIATRFAPVEAAAAADPSAAVRLSWLEGMPSQAVAARSERLWKVAASDADAAVRAQAIDVLRQAGQVGDAARVLALYRAFRDDEMPDARAAALVAAAAFDEVREQVAELALADPDPVVAALVAHGTGLRIERPPREARHGQKWYRDLTEWVRDDHWLDIVTTRGVVRLKLDPDAAITAREVWDLAERGFYDGLSFHRVVPNFVVQGGDPRGDGWGGPGFVLSDEPTDTPFDAWRVGIATSGPNTGGCQLFITLLPEDRLAGHYTNFAEVVRGREVVERIRMGDAILRVDSATGAEPPAPPPTLVGDLAWTGIEKLDGWQAEHQGYAPDPSSIELLRTAGGSYQVLVVLGTWCSDSLREVPRLQRVVDEVGGDRLDLRLLGVDRSRRVDDNVDLPEGLLADRVVDRVPTIIVVGDDGLELGRVVETAEAPLEQLLVEFLAPAEGW